jgi:hypothetical protein
MDYYRNYLIAVAIFTPIFAFVAKLTARLFGADVRFLTALASTFVGYCFAILSGIIWGLVSGGHLSMQVRLLVGACGMVLAHTIFLRSRDSERVGLLTAALVTVAQLATGFGIRYAVDSALAK